MYGKLLSSRRVTLKRGRCSLIRLYSSSSASTSECVTVTSMAAICCTSACTFGAILPGFKEGANRSRKLRALPTYSRSCFALYMRYTPGRLGSEPTNSLGSNVAKLHRATHDGSEHFRGQPARLCVIAAAMIRVDQMQ